MRSWSVWAEGKFGVLRTESEINESRKVSSGGGLSSGFFFPSVEFLSLGKDAVPLWEHIAAYKYEAEQPFPRVRWVVRVENLGFTSR